MRIVHGLGLLVLTAGLFSGCVMRSDVRADAALRAQAMEAYDAGDMRRVRAIVSKADSYYVPNAVLWRRTMELRAALAEGTQQGELRLFLRAWGEQRDDWSQADLANAEMTLAETLTPAYAVDWLYDLDPSGWQASQRTRYNLLMAKLQRPYPALRDDATTRWLVAVRGMYTHGNVQGAANEALRCAKDLQSANAALIAAKLYNELGQAKAKEDALQLALTYSSTKATRQEVTLIRSAALGTRSTF